MRINSFGKFCIYGFRLLTLFLNLKLNNVLVNFYIVTFITNYANYIKDLKLKNSLITITKTGT